MCIVNSAYSSQLKSIRRKNTSSVCASMRVRVCIATLLRRQNETQYKWHSGGVNKKKKYSSVVWLLLMMSLSGVMSTLLDHIANYPLSSPPPKSSCPYHKVFLTSAANSWKIRGLNRKKKSWDLRTLFCLVPPQSRLKKDNYHLSWMNFPITQLNQHFPTNPQSPLCSLLSSGFKHNLYKQQDLCILHMLFFLFK